MTDLAFETPLGPRVLIAGEERDYFSGTGYLGLHNHPAVQEATLHAILRYGMSTATSRGGYGEHTLYDELESEAALFFAAESVLYYPTGYLSALVLAQGLSESCERAFVDEAAHYSILDGVRAAGLPFITFRHCDPQALREALRTALRPGERPLLLSDGVFPISGEIVPLPSYLEEMRAYAGARLAFDDAHSAGVLGPNGRGTLDYYGLDAPDCLAGATLSKALGGYGGILPTTAVQLSEMTRHVKAYGGSSPPPLPAAAASAAALRIARTTPELRATLRANVFRLRSGLRSQGWECPDTPVPIICLAARPGLDLAAIRARLFEQRICVAHVTSYSSTPLGGCLRIAIFANHSTAQIDGLLEKLGSPN